MIDFNSSSSVSRARSPLVDAGMQQARARRSERQYLGASRLGRGLRACAAVRVRQGSHRPRARHPGRMLRIFERGHVMEDCMVAWLRDAGFDLRTRKADGEQFGFSVADGRLQGHIDGVIVGGLRASPIRALGMQMPGQQVLARPGEKGWPFPNRSTPRKWRSTKPISNCTSTRRSSRRSTPTRWRSTPRLVPFDAALAQRMSDRAVKVITATEAGELLPRAFMTRPTSNAGYCAWQDRCWRIQHEQTTRCHHGVGR